MIKNAKTNTKAVRTQYDMFDEATKSYITAVLYTISSMFYAIYQIQNTKNQEEEKRELV